MRLAASLAPIAQMDLDTFDRVQRVNVRGTFVIDHIASLNADEDSTLTAWLDFHRATLAIKCAGLNGAQAATASTPPSTFTLIGRVQHMAEVERSWFRRVFAGEQAPPIYDPEADPGGPDGGFAIAEGATLEGALAT